MAGFLESLIGTESGGNWQAQNSVKGAGGMTGHFGRLQFGRARLQDAMNAGVIPQGVTPEQFMADPAMQQRVEAWHFSDIDRNAANMGLTKYVGQTVGGIPITPEAIRAMAHLGGIGGAAKFLETGGRHNPADAYGTSLADYARKHGGAMGGGDMRGSGGNPLVMGGAGGDIMQPEKPKGLLGFLGDEDKRARLAMALEGMTLNPNQGYMMMLSEGIKDRRTTKAADAAKNKTAAWLRSQGREDLAAAIESGVMNGSDAARMAMEKPDPLAQINLELKQLELQQARNPTPDPLVALEIEKRRLELERLRNPVAEPSSSLGKLEADYRAGLISEEMYKAEMASMAPQGSVIESDGQGGFRMVTGAGVGTSAKPFTEAQGKDNAFATRAEGALKTLEPVAGALTGLSDKMLDMDPTGILRGALQSDPYQLARQAGDEYLQAILRKDTGAAITVPEQELYGKTYLPQPGDNAAVLEQKATSRVRAVEALKAGMSAAQIEAMALADKAVIDRIKAGGDNPTPPTSGPVIITSDAEYNALPSGATFVGPDGKTRRKP